MAEQREVPERLTYLAYQMLFPEQFPDTTTVAFDKLRVRIEGLWEKASDEDRRSLRRVRRDVEDPVEDNPGGIQDRLLWLLARDPIVRSARAAGFEGDIGPGDVSEAEQHSSARVAIGAAGAADKRRLERWAGNARGGGGTAGEGDGTGGITVMEITREGEAMPEETWESYEGEFEIDRRNLPETFDEFEFRAEIERLFRNRNAGSSPLAQAHRAYVGGSLIRSSYFEPDSPGFEAAFVDEFDKGFETVEVVNDGQVMESRDKRYLDLYARVAERISVLKTGAPTVQEVAAVSDAVAERGPVNDNFAAKVRSALDDFVAKTPVYDSLDLPAIVKDETAQAEVEPQNINAVAMIYSASQVEKTGLADVVDQIAVDWSDGVLPVGEAAGGLFDGYVFGAHGRLDAAARDIQYERIGDIHGHLLRFCSAASERDRSQYLSEYLLDGPDRHRSAQPRDAAVRKAARDLLAYASLHGWAYTRFAAKRLANQIREYVAIVKHPEVQKAYGVQGPWQVVERVSAMTSGTTPNIAKHRALASTGKAILDMLASKAVDIAASVSSDPLFPPLRDAGFQYDGADTAVFTSNEYRILMNHVENWLAASLVNDRQRFEEAQLRETAPSASLPSFDGSGNGMGFDSGVIKDQLMQMVSSGQVPTTDQIDQLFAFGN